ncbi:glycoside hydrolase family 2 protein [Candidatus Latescibacterota bacterium]
MTKCRAPFVKYAFAMLIVLFLCVQNADADPGRWEMDISGDGWSLWLDRDADWKDDELYLPPVDVSALPVNPPTCGWERLGKVSGGKDVSVPGTVEEYFWSANGNPNGIAGDYRGVSWWSRTFTLDGSLRGKRITLAFDSVNLRAEIFLNNRLVGYDVIGNTPFDIDITDTVRLGSENRLDVRITDPVGTFSWDDENMLRWGNNTVPSVHGFGGITGKVIVRAVDAVHIDDIYVQNQKKANRVNIFITVGNSSGQEKNGELSLEVYELNNPRNIIYEKTVSGTVQSGGSKFSFDVNAPHAKLWDIQKPNLYVASVRFTGDEDIISDSLEQRFGFRWFDVGEKDGDKRFYLNGRRVFLFAAMTRGFWPKSGMFPTPEIAASDMEIAIEMGFNMMLYHRAIGQPISMDVADEVGVMSYEEPGGYMSNPAPNETAQRWRKEKLKRMVIRDRSRPSMVIFNIDDLSSHAPTEWDKENMLMVRELDPSRIITFNCINPPHAPNIQDDPFKLHMLPYDDTFYYHGWIAPYHFFEQPGYVDKYYNNPRYYLRYVLDKSSTAMGDSLYPVEKDEIIFYGEEGGFGTMMRLEKIKNELMRTGADGWREGEHLDWFSTYDRFLDESGFRSVFPTVDEFTLALGETMHYVHGRNIENTRISNKSDAYVINGWASAMTHTDIVDTYRNPTADPEIIKYYMQPLYIAVKIRDKVLPAGAVPVADIFIVNEVNLRGRHSLTLTFENPSGEILHTETVNVRIQGGEEYGQLLLEELVLPPVTVTGYYTLKASLLDSKGEVIATGSDKIFTADYISGPGITGSVAVIDTSGTINSLLNKARGVTLANFDPFGSEPDCIIVGAHNYNRVRQMGVVRGTRSMWPIMDMVANGTTLIILDQADRWAEQMSAYYHKSIKYTDVKSFGDSGRFFVGNSILLSGLPVNQAMNWEYQTFYQRNIRGLGLDWKGLETVVGIAAENTDSIHSALIRVPYGEGEIILSTLNLLPELTSERPQSAVAKKLLLNLIEKN